jgi:hypothetical protein
MMPARTSQMGRLRCGYRAGPYSLLRDPIRSRIRAAGGAALLMEEDGKLPLALAYQLCWDALWGAMLENVLVASSTARRDLSAIARLS